MYNFFESLRLDLRESGVDVTVITPGYVRSEMTEKNEHSMPFLRTKAATASSVKRGRRLGLGQRAFKQHWCVAVPEDAFREAAQERTPQPRVPVGGQCDQVHTLLSNHV